MQINVKTFNALAVVVGLALTAAVWHHMATNPRWAGDNGPGVGKLPREIVSGFLSKAYEEGKGQDAVELYMSKKVVDLAPDASDRQNGSPQKHTVRWLVAEGQSVVVWHCIEGSPGRAATEIVDIFRTTNGRIVGRVRPAVQALTAETCPAGPDGKFTGLR